MKKTAKMSVVIALCLACVLAFAACSTMPKIKKAFENDDWKVTEFGSVSVGDTGSVTVYSVTKSLHVAIIIEGTAGTDFVEFYKELQKDEDVDAALKAIIKTINQTPVVNGNCAIVTLSSKAVEVFSSVK